MERFVKVKKYGIPYFVSNYGRVKKESGFFMTPMMVKNSGGLFVHLRVDPNNYKRKLISLAALVLDSFYGGYAKNRRVRYKDCDRKNCRLENLSWKYGWTGKVDFSKIDMNILDNDDKLIVNYLRTNDLTQIQRLITNHAGMLHETCKFHKGVSYYEDVKIELIIKLKEIFDSGRYKPNQDKIVGLMRSITQFYLRDIKVVNHNFDIIPTDVNLVL